MLADYLKRCFFDREPVPSLFELRLSNGAAMPITGWDVDGEDRSATAVWVFPEGAEFDSVTLVGDGEEIETHLIGPVRVAPDGEFEHTFTAKVN